MTTTPTPLEDAPHWARPLHERLIVLAGDLAEEAREVARTLARRVAAVDADDSLSDAEAVPVLEGLARAHARMARSTRLSLMLQDRLIKDLIAFDKGEVPDAGRDDRKDEIRQIVRIIVDPRDDPETRERLDREIMERLERESESLEAAALSCPVGENMTVILKDLYAEGSRLAGGYPGRPLNSSPIGGGGPDEASAKSSGGGLPEAGTDGPVPLHQTLRVRSPSQPALGRAAQRRDPWGGGIERDPAPP